MATWANEWGTVVVAIIGVFGMLGVQMIASHRDRANQKLQLQHQSASELRLRRVQAYSDLVDASNHLALLIPEALIKESTARDLNSEERSPFNRAMAKAQLLATAPVQLSIYNLSDAVYRYADKQSPKSWKAIDKATDAFIDAVQSESDTGNILGIRQSKKRKAK